MLKDVPTEVVDIICSYVDDIDMDYKMEWRGKQLYAKWNWFLFCETIPRNIVEKYCLSDNDYSGCKKNFWNTVSFKGNFPKSFWEKFIHDIQFDLLIYNPHIPESFLKYSAYKTSVMYYGNSIYLPWDVIQRNMSYLNWGILSRCVNVPIHIFEQHINELDWYHFSNNPSVPEWFYEKYIDRVSFYTLCINKNISIEFFEKYINRVEWNCICINNSIPIEFFETHIDKIIWHQICRNNSIPIEFFEKHIDRVDWYNIAMNESIPTWFVEKYIHRYHPSYFDGNKGIWSNICRFYPLTVEFLEKYIADLNWYGISLNKHIPLHFYEKYVDKLDKRSFTANLTIPTWFYEKYHDKMNLKFLRRNENFIQYVKSMEHKKVIHELFTG